MERLLTVFITLSVVLSVVSAGMPTATLFPDWLEQKTAPSAEPSTKAAAASYHEDAEFEHVCFQAAAIRHCRCIGCTDNCAPDADGVCNSNYRCCQEFHFQSVLKCCPGDEDGYGHRRHADNFAANFNYEIGACEFTQFSFDDVIQVVFPNVVQWGTFNAVCEVRGGKCDHPFCDHLVLKWTGSAQIVHDAISVTNPQKNLDASCGGEDRRKVFGGRALTRMHTNDTSRGEPVKARPAVKAASDGTPSYYLSDADVYYGPVTISSRKYNIKYSQGFMQYVDWYPTSAGPVVTENEAAGKHLVRPFTYTLQMQRSLESY